MADNKEIRTVKTTRGELQYYINWDNDGSIDMVNPQTIKTYFKCRDNHPDCDEHGVFFAFSDKQYYEGVEHLKRIGKFRENEKLQRVPSSGLIGYHDCIDSFFACYEENDRRIKEECDPQEVYFYEYNNHESMIAFDGDKDAFKIVCSIFGEEACKGIKRFSVYS